MPDSSISNNVSVRDTRNDRRRRRSKSRTGARSLRHTRGGRFVLSTVLALFVIVGATAILSHMLSKRPPTPEEVDEEIARSSR